MVRNVASISSNLPQLPEQKFLTIEVGYNDARPLDYFAPGFGNPVEDESRFPNTDSWNKVTTPIHRMDTGYHGISLVVSHLENKDECVEKIVPNNMTYTQQVDKADDIEHDLALRLRPSGASEVSSYTIKPAKGTHLDGRRGDLSSLSTPVAENAVDSAHLPSTKSSKPLVSRTRPTSYNTWTKRQLNNMVLLLSFTMC